ncbi:MAG: hypothetical protein JNK76_06065 [Planctomycetales bacterium]|nr:hypothetical protein [Planctomycetales bacterium]MBN8627120.1 hypothetical protein [Planctomycetota bacterium]
MSDESLEPVQNELTLLSERALAVDWNRPEEEAAWKDLRAIIESNDE